MELRSTCREQQPTVPHEVPPPIPALTRVLTPLPPRVMLRLVAGKRVKVWGREERGPLLSLHRAPPVKWAKGRLRLRLSDLPTVFKATPVTVTKTINNGGRWAGTWNIPRTARLHSTGPRQTTTSTNSGSRSEPTFAARTRSRFPPTCPRSFLEKQVRPQSVASTSGTWEKFVRGNHLRQPQAPIRTTEAHYQVSLRDRRVRIIEL